MATWCQRIAASDGFRNFILALIVLNAVLFGLETNAALLEHFGEAFFLAFAVSQGIFIVEMAIRIGACAPRYSEFFKDSWNTFDLTIVIVSLIPAVGGFAVVARVARVLRVARLLSTSAAMRTFLEGMGRSTGLFLRAAALLAILGYIFAIAGYHLFGETTPASWGTLGASLRSVFLLALLQQVPYFLAEVGPGDTLGHLFFPIFYLVFLTVGSNLIGAVTELHRQSSGQGE